MINPYYFITSWRKLFFSTLRQKTFGSCSFHYMLDILLFKTSIEKNTV